MLSINPSQSVIVEFYGRFPKLGGTILGVPIIGAIVFLRSILGYPYFGKPPYLARRPVNNFFPLCFRHHPKGPGGHIVYTWDPQVPP